MVSINDIEVIALPLMNRKSKGSEDIFILRFRSRFGVDPSNVIEFLVAMMLERL